MIQQLLEVLGTTVPRAAGDNLTGFLIDADASLAEEPFFGEAAVPIPAEVSGPINIAISLAPTAKRLSLGHLAEALRRVWFEVAYTTFQASALTFYRDMATFEFVTVPDGRPYYVSGAIVVSGPTYERLAAGSGLALSLAPHS